MPRSTLLQIRKQSLTNHEAIWVFPKNRGTPKSSILIGFSIINHPFWGTPIFGNTHLATPKLLTFKTAPFRQTLALGILWWLMVEGDVFRPSTAHNQNGMTAFAAVGLPLQPFYDSICIFLSRSLAKNQGISDALNLKKKRYLGVSLCDLFFKENQTCSFERSECSKWVFPKIVGFPPKSSICS